MVSAVENLDAFHRRPTRQVAGALHDPNLIAGITDAQAHRAAVDLAEA